MTNETIKNTPELPDEERLLQAILEEEPSVAEAKRKATEWRVEHSAKLTVDDIIIATEVAQDLVAQDFEKWDEMDDEEKADLSAVLCSLMVARDLLADMFGLPTQGRIVKEDAEDDRED